MELLLLSNSRSSNGFLVDYLAEIKDFAAGARRAGFVPFASVQRPWPEFTAMVGEVLEPFEIEQVEHPEDLENKELVVVGGGNTFQLLRECRRRGLLEAIGAKVRKGMKYIGWSAGANLACPTIRTTNDMPIVDPQGLEAIGLLPFQLNPHYTEGAIAGHQGETRPERLREYAKVNPALPVLALPEGAWLRVSGAAIELRGPHPALWFRGEAPPAPVSPGRLSL